MKEGLHRRAQGQLGSAVLVADTPNTSVNTDLTKKVKNVVKRADNDKEESKHNEGP